jgi:hypothetical protein
MPCLLKIEAVDQQVCHKHFTASSYKTKSLTEDHAQLSLCTENSELIYKRTRSIVTLRLGSKFAVWQWNLH